MNGQEHEKPRVNVSGQAVDPIPQRLSGRADDYSDIIDLPHHTSSGHPRMAPEMRAAQFAPFAALTGFEETIEETAYRQKAEVYRRDRMKD